jgi:hypothetical protein
MEKYWRFFAVAAAWALFLIGTFRVMGWARSFAVADWKYFPLYIGVAMIVVAAWQEFWNRPPRP